MASTYHHTAYVVTDALGRYGSLSGHWPWPMRSPEVRSFFRVATLQAAVVLSARAYEQLAPDLVDRVCICVSSNVGAVRQSKNVYWAPNPVTALDMAELFQEQGITHGGAVVLGGARILQQLGPYCSDWIIEEWPAGAGDNADIPLILEEERLATITVHDFDDVKVRIRRVRK